MNVGLDLDYTIFDTSGFYAELPCNMDTFLNTFELLYLEKKYSPTRHAYLLRARGVDTTGLEIHKAYRTAPKYVADREYLRKFCRDNEVYLVTRASHRGWQRKKAHAAGILDWFEGVRVADSNEPKQFDDLDFMIDDNAEELEGHRNAVIYENGDSLAGLLSELKD